MNETLQSRFEATVDRFAERIALVSGRVCLTYAELDRRANRLGHRLLELGAGPETLIGICLPRDIDLVAGMVAIVKCGGAYLPLDPEHPRERLAFYLKDSGASILVTTVAIAVEVPAGVHVIHLDEDAGRLSEYPDSRPPAKAQPDNLAYVIYTSGSTGVPKGVMVTQRNIVRLFDTTDPWYRFTEDDVWTLFHSAAFDFSVWEIWGALLYGAKLIVIPFAVSRRPAEVAALIGEQGVTVLNQTPSAFRQVGRAIVDGRVEHSLRYIIFGGEALDFASLRPWVARFGAERTALINMYGITETTVHTTYRRLTSEDVAAARGSLIGGPLPDLRVLVLDERLQPVAPGETGEIFVTGAGVARGYLNRPELTAQLFIEIDGQRAYRSGDLARPSGDGDFEYLGRVDHQVKIRGFRIELGEISARLGNHPRILDNAVIAVGPASDARIVAYCVPRDAKPLAAELRRYLARHVPDYMVPAAFVFLEALPLTANGKLDRTALPLPEEDSAPFREPQTAAERLAARVWCDVLGLKRVGCDDNFIALGGQSLAAAEAISRIAGERGIELSFASFLQAPTLADLARTIDAAKPMAAVTPPVPVPRDSPPPASLAQQRLWIEWRRDPKGVAYNETIAIRMAKPVDTAALQSALRALGQRHESLRTTFRYVDGELAQAIHNFPTVELLRRDAADEPEALAAAARMAATPIDLEAGPLWRALLVRFGDADFRLYVTIHHIVWDALSEPVFVGELERLYRAAQSGAAANLPPLPFQSADAAVWERNRLASIAPASQIEYWKKKLGGELPVLELPSRRPRSANPSSAGAREPVRFDATLSAELREFARRENATLFQLLLAAMYCTLSVYTGADDIVLGAVVDRRLAAGIEKLIGYYVQPLVLRTRLDGNPAFRELLARVRETSLEAQNHADVPLEKLIEVLRPKRLPGVQPLFQAGLAWGPATEPPGEWTWRHYDVFSGHSKFDISWQLEDLPEGLTGHLEYKTDVVERELATRLARHIGAVLRAALADPGRRIHDLAPLSGAEREELLEWKRVRSCAPSSSSAAGAPRAAVHATMASEELERSLRAHLAARLPDYMMPAAFVVVDALPLSPSGKVDRKALPPPPNSRPSAPFVSAPLANNGSGAAVQEVVSATWREVLGLNEVPLDAAFFDIGGHSLALARVQVRLRERLKVDVDMMALFNHLTVRKLASYLEAMPGLARGSPAAAPEPVRDEPRPVPLDLQKGGIAIVGYACADASAEGASFDAEFFGMSEDEAAKRDPLHLLFLECAWAALEDAGYDPRRYGAGIGAFGGTAVPAFTIPADLSTRLTLGGPCTTVQAEGATALAAVHTARLSLLARDCDMAVAGAVSRHGERTVGMLGVLKRHQDAIADGDSILGVIHGSAMSGDGSAGRGEAAVKSAVQTYRNAGVNPANLGLLVAPAAAAPTVSRAFRRFTQKREFCALLSPSDGSDPMAVILQALEREEIPASQTASGTLSDSPFYAPAKPIPWKRGRVPRRAAVSMAGGGNHVHLILEEPDIPASQAVPRPMELLCLSARTPSALDDLRRRLTEYLSRHPGICLADVAFTLQCGRAEFAERCALSSGGGALDSETWIRGTASPGAAAIPFSLTGCSVSWELYAAVAVYRTEIDHVLQAARSETAGDLPAAMSLTDANPVLGAVASNWALARTLMALGVTPQSVAATGPARLAAAAVAGVFSLKDAVAVAAARDVERLRRVRLRPAEIPIAGAQGTVLSRSEALDPRYWSAALTDSPSSAAEIPGAISFAGIADSPDLFALLGRLWTGGRSIEWSALYSKGSVRRVRLPGHPFQKGSRVEPRSEPPVAANRATTPTRPLQPSRNFTPLVERLLAREAQLQAGHPVRSIEAEPGLRERLDAYCASRVYDLFVASGGVTPETMVRSAELIRRMGVQAEWTRFFQYLLAVLARARDATVLDTRIRFRNPVPGRSHRLAQEVSRACPAAQSLLDLVDTAVEWIPEVFRGKAGELEPRKLPAWSASAEWRHEPAMRTLATDACQALMEELGGCVLRVDHATLARGLPQGMHSIAMAEEAVGGQRDVAAAMASIRSSIPETGAAVLLERTRVETWEQMVLGLSSAWWGFDANRRSAAVLPAAQWEEISRQAGFADFAAFPRATPPNGAGGLSLFLLFPNSVRGGDA